MRITNKKRGRKVKKIDWEIFDKLCAKEFTLPEMAEVFSCSEDTLQRAIKKEKGMNFAVYLGRYYKKNCTGPKVNAIDWNIFNNLCAHMNTLDDIADIFNCSRNTIRRAVKREKDMSFENYYKSKSATGRASLRSCQFKMAKNNATMAIFLGKQYLGQKDKQGLEHKGVVASINNMTSEEIDERIAALDNKIKQAKKNNKSLY